MARRRSKKEKPKYNRKPPNDTVRTGGDPNSYLKKHPVWKFCDFDWEGPWGFKSCDEHSNKLRGHFEQHLAHFESMTWGEILKASGGRGKGKGNNNHEISRDKFKKIAINRLDGKNILSDNLFSLRLTAGVRLYGVREFNCLKIVFFDPYHKNQTRCAYDFSK